MSFKSKKSKKSKQPSDEAIAYMGLGLIVVCAAAGNAVWEGSKLMYRKFLKQPSLEEKVFSAVDNASIAAYDSIMSSTPPKSRTIKTDTVQVLG